MDRCVLGLDTSCYTTSVALVSQNGLEGDFRAPLSVKPGEKGLRQSEALFQHVRNLPHLLEKVKQSAGRQVVSAVAASTRPRPQHGSYMPVFTAGSSFASAIASMLGVPFFETTHQEGHLEAGFRSCGQEPALPMLAVHLSGGTSELMRAARRPGGWEIALLGGTQDLSAGQFVDRVGQALGLPFPAGPALEKLAASGIRGEVVIPAPVHQYSLSFSGPATAALRAIEGGARAADVALAALLCIAKGLEKLLRKAVTQENLADVLVVGGVAANRIIRDRLVASLEGPLGAHIHFARPAFSSDNAIGVAYLGLERLGRPGERPDAPPHAGVVETPK